jgi:hypothetical protein
MIIEELNVNAVHSTPPINTIKMRVSDDDVNRFIPFFRDYLYSNKILAPIREYSTNARDEHIENGTPELPIQVTLPSTFAPEFKVRDFGAGLTMKEIDDVYVQYLIYNRYQDNH